MVGIWVFWNGRSMGIMIFHNLQVFQNYYVIKYGTLMHTHKHIHIHM